MGAGTRAQLRQYNIRLKKHLGQNFLFDKNILARLADAAELTDTDTVLEIGPGSGNFTVQLAQRAGTVIAVEVDQQLEPLLTANLAPFSNIHLVWGDFLQLSWNQLWQIAATSSGATRRKVAANLPYHITSPVLVKLLTEMPKPDLAVLLMQMEVAQRLVASPGTKEYGSLSVLTQFYCYPELVLKVPPTVFFPRPKVWSTAVRLRFRSQPAVLVDDEQFFRQVVRASFRHRRKTLVNSLLYGLNAPITGDCVAAVLENANIDPARRGETLDLEEFGQLTKALVDHLGL